MKRVLVAAAVGVVLVVGLLLLKNQRQQAEFAASSQPGPGSATWRTDPEVNAALSQLKAEATPTEIDPVVALLKQKGAECHERNKATFLADLNLVLLRQQVPAPVRGPIAEGVCGR